MKIYFSSGHFMKKILKVFDPLNNFISSLEPRPQVESSFNLDAFLKGSFAEAMPKINIPKFSGKHAEWSNFKELFLATIDQREDLTPAMKLVHLKTLLTNDALDKVKGFPAKDDKYEEAWSTLNIHCENKRHLVDFYMSEFAAVKPMKAETSSELKRLIKETLTPLESLSFLEHNVDLWDALLVFFTVSRFGR